jgi:outer membrane protein OmpA-like peptidoglycan-associated protein
MRATILSFFVASLVAASPAFAGGGEKGDWELGGYGGRAWLGDYGTYHPKDHLFYGGRLGYFLTSNWNLEVAAQRVPTESDFLVPPLTDRDVKLDAVRLNLLYSFASGSRFRPFLTGGGGRDRTTVVGFVTENDWGWNGGGGFRVFFTPMFNFRVDGRVAGVHVGEPVNQRETNVEGTAGLSLVFGGGSKPEAPPPAPAPPDQPPVVSCTTDRSEIMPGETVSITANATDPEGEPLTYAWNASTGRVNGSGPTATLDMTGATPPANATITVSVSDTHGNTASSECAVRLVEPPKPAEAVSCMAGGFPRNLSRLTNVDKACLDDVVQRLKADPRARVIVIGHADAHERSPEGIGKKRADAIEDYLEQAGVDSKRITTRSAGASKLLDSGTELGAQARNRRVEVWFVPEGAKEPE